MSQLNNPTAPGLLIDGRQQMIQGLVSLLSFDTMRSMAQNAGDIGSSVNQKKYMENYSTQYDPIVDYCR